MAVAGSPDRAGRRGGRALLLGPPRLRQLTRGLARLALLAALLPGCSVSGETGDGGDGGDRATATVTKVTDGDTLRLSGVGSTRLIGIDTPETYGRDECFGREAAAFAERTVPPGTEVRYRLGIEERDRYGRALAYVYLRDGRLLNELLTERGFAQPLTIPPNDDLADRFVAAARRARERKLGLWRACPVTTALRPGSR